MQVGGEEFLLKRSEVAQHFGWQDIPQNRLQVWNVRECKKPLLARFSSARKGKWGAFFVLPLVLAEGAIAAAGQRMMLLQVVRFVPLVCALPLRTLHFQGSLGLSPQAGLAEPQPSPAFGNNHPHPTSDCHRHLSPPTNAFKTGT